MKSTPTAREFSIGGWFGSLIGSTIWVPLFTMAYIGSNPGFAIINLAFCLACVGLGTFLWFKRERFSMMAAIQILLFASFLPSVATIISAVLMKVSDARPSLLSILLIYPYLAISLSLMFRHREKAVVGQNSPPDPRSPKA